MYFISFEVGFAEYDAAWALCFGAEELHNDYYRCEKLNDPPIYVMDDFSSRLRSSVKVNAYMVFLTKNLFQHVEFISLT
jgi:hypothetical protein